MDTHREKVIKAVEKVSKLRQELAAAEHELDLLLPAETGAKPPLHPSAEELRLEEQRVDDQIVFVPGSLPHRIYYRMTVDSAKTEFKADDFSDMGDMQNIRSALFRMAKTGKLSKVGHGLYAVAHP